jgi:hypothetical protein
MSSSAAEVRRWGLSMLAPPMARRRRKASAALTRQQARERSIRRRVVVAWGLLFLNVLTFYRSTWSGQPLLVPIPYRIGQLITQGALPAALGVALTINRRILIRPNVFLCLLSLLIVEAFIAFLGHPLGHLTGTLYRTVRLAGFTCTLWLLTPWWGRRDMLLLKALLIPLALSLGSVLLGLILAPGRALANKRLSGVLWPMPPTQVADFAAATIGLVVVLWFCGFASKRVTIVVVSLAGLELVLAHARTELIGMTAGVVVASLSLFAFNARVRKFFTGASLIVSIAIITLSGFFTAWLARGQKGEQLSSFTSRTEVWGPLLAFRRDRLHEMIGFGLSNKSFNGLAIDSNWLAAYWDLGLIGVGLCAALLLFVFVSAFFRPPGPQRALALFLVAYLLVRSFFETGLTDSSVNLLELTLAASLLASPVGLARATTRMKVQLVRNRGRPAASWHSARRPFQSSAGNAPSHNS